MAKKHESSDGNKFKFGYEMTRIFCPRCREYKSLKAHVIPENKYSDEMACECGNKFSIGFVGK